MKIIKRYAALLTVLALSLSCMAGAAGAVETELPFADVTPESWCYTYVKDVYENRLFSGTSATTFNPDGAMTRAMFVTVLYRQSRNLGKDLSAPAAKFTDISQSNQEFQTAIAWAAAHGVVNGTTETTFTPNRNVNRQEMCAIIVRYLRDYLGYDVSGYRASVAGQFADAEKIASFASEAVGICWSMGIVNGKTVNGQSVFDPAGNATRGAVAKVISIQAKVEQALRAAAAAAANPVTPEPQKPAGTQKPAQTEKPGTTTPGKTDKPGSTETHTAEEIAEEKEIIGYLDKIVSEYDKITITNEKVKNWMDTVTDTLDDALDQHNSGNFVDRDYIDNKYGDTIGSAKDQFNAFSEEDESAARNAVLSMDVYVDEFVAVFDYFGFSLPV